MAIYHGALTRAEAYRAECATARAGVVAARIAAERATLYAMMRWDCWHREMLPIDPECRIALVLDWPSIRANYKPRSDPHYGLYLRRRAELRAAYLASEAEAEAAAEAEQSIEI